MKVRKARDGTGKKGAVVLRADQMVRPIYEFKWKSEQGVRR